MAITRVLIAVKTYPLPSAKYDELVCTAGFRDDGSWIRIYPVPLRKLPYEMQYKKYDWIEVDIEKNPSDFRPESYRPKRIDMDLKMVGHIEPDHNWEKRKKYALKNTYYNLTELIAEARNTQIGTSLATFKPASIINFKIEETEKEWEKKTLEKLRQFNMFQSTNEKQFEIVHKLPYKFSYVFTDNNGRESTLMIEDWEIGELYWKCLARHEGNELKACADVKKKYFDDLAKTKDIYLFLGTTKEYHNIAPNPFIIIGVFYPKFNDQFDIF